MIYVTPTTFSEICILTKIVSGGPPERANTLQLGGCFTRIRLTQTEPKLWQVARKFETSEIADLARDNDMVEMYQEKRQGRALR